MFSIENNSLAIINKKRNVTKSINRSLWSMRLIYKVNILFFCDFSAIFQIFCEI